MHKFVRHTTTNQRFCIYFVFAIIAFYDKKVFYLDNDGYLSYDFDREGIFDKEYNAELELNN